MKRLAYRIQCLGTGLLLATLCASAADLPDQVRAGLRKACDHWANKVASHGGFVWEYSADLTTRRRGESKDIPASTVWVQSGTPMVGEAFLKAYRATGEKAYLEAALAAGRCLAYGQLASGGWAYSIEFDPARNDLHYHHLGEAGKGKKNTTTFDDDNTQSATRFLMRLDHCVDDPMVKTAVERAIGCFLEAQYKGGNWDGAWPQRYPPPKTGYGRLPTFNDNTMSDCVRTMLLAWELSGREDCLQSVKRCLEFYLRSQQPAPQTTWAQQCDEDLKPAWARKFEPPSVTGGESCGNCRLLMDMYERFCDGRYLAAVGQAVDWYRRSRIGGTEENGIWARFYEVGSNRPLYFTRTYKLTYEDDDLPVHYSFQNNYGVNRMITRYEALRKLSATDLEKRREAQTKTAAQYAAKAKSLAPKAEGLLASQDEQGRWVKLVGQVEQVRDKKGRIIRTVDDEHKLPMIYSRTFVHNVSLLCDYLVAVQGGPKVEGK
jgi:PelA/Pel-15E family pectate lyase